MKRAEAAARQPEPCDGCFDQEHAAAARAAARLHVVAPDDDLAKQEVAAHTHWGGGRVDYIHSRLPAPPQPPLPAAIEKMVLSLWKDSEHGATRSSGLRAGDHRSLAGASPGFMNKVEYSRIVPPVTGAAAKFGKPDKVSHLQGIARDWQDHVDLKRVCGFSFRGETRAPAAIQTQGGFFPNSQRNDQDYIEKTVIPQFAGYMKRRFDRDVTKEQVLQAMQASPDLQGDALRDMLVYMTWRAMAKQEEMHLGRHLAEQALKGFISTTRAVKVARGFTYAGGYVYVVFLDKGMVVPRKDSTQWTKLFNEQEVASPGPIYWDQVAGWREAVQGKFRGPIRLRTAVIDTEPKAAQEIYELLSGKAQ